MRERYYGCTVAAVSGIALTCHIVRVNDERHARHPPDHFIDLGCRSNRLATGNAAKRVPIGLEIYSVREEFKKNEMTTLEQLAPIGYECVEFHGVYADWTPQHAKEIRSKLDSLKMKCYSTHNSKNAFYGDGLDKAVELKKILERSTLFWPVRAK